MWYVVLLLSDGGVPTSVDFVRSETNQMIVSYSSSNAYIFDLEKATPIHTLHYSTDSECFLLTEKLENIYVFIIAVNFFI